MPASSTSSADSTSPIDRKIAELENVEPTAPLYYIGPDRYAPVLDLRKLATALNVAVMKPLMSKFDNSKQPNARVVTRWFVSADFLPVLKDWKEECFDNNDMLLDLNNALHMPDDPTHSPNVEQLACCAFYYHDILDKRVEFIHEQRNAILACAEFVRRFVQRIKAYIMHYLDGCVYPNIELFQYEWSARALITVYTDLVRNHNGFFATALSSHLAEAMTPEVRLTCERTLKLLGKFPDLERYTPPIELQRAAITFASVSQTKLAQNTKTDCRTSLTKTTEFQIAAQFNSRQRQFHEQSNKFPEFLTASGDGEDLFTLPATVPERIESHNMMCEVHQLVIKHEQNPKPTSTHKRKRDRETTSEPVKTNIQCKQNSAATSTRKHKVKRNAASTPSDNAHHPSAKPQSSEVRPEPDSDEKAKADGDLISEKAAKKTLEQVATTGAPTEKHDPASTSTREHEVESNTIFTLNDNHDSDKPQLHESEVRQELSLDVQLKTDDDLVSSKPAEHSTKQTVATDPRIDTRFHISNGQIAPASGVSATSCKTEQFTTKEQLVL